MGDVWKCHGVDRPCRPLERTACLGCRGVKGGEQWCSDWKATSTPILRPMLNVFVSALRAPGLHIGVYHGIQLLRNAPVLVRAQQIPYPLRYPSSLPVFAFLLFL